MGQSHDNNYDDDEFDQRFPRRPPAGNSYRHPNTKSKKKKKNKKSVQLMDDDTSSVISTTSSVDSTMSLKGTQAIPKKTGKPMHQRSLSAEVSHLRNMTEDEQEDGAGSGSYAAPRSGSSLPPAALKLERQLSGSDVYIDYLDLSDSRYDWKQYPFEINKVIGSVNLSNNNLYDMPYNFLQLPQLRAISFASNLIRNVEISHRMEHLTVLELQSNKISTFPSAEVLDNLPVLKKLILFNNAIKDIPKESVLKLAAMNTIEEINISYNGLTSLPSQIGKLASLTALRLSNNKLRSLPVNITALNIADSYFSIFGNRLSSPPQVSLCLHTTANYRYDMQGCAATAYN